MLRRPAFAGASSLRPSMLVPLFRRPSFLSARSGFPSVRRTAANETAILAAREAARDPGGLFSPLLLVGPPGSGKSELLAALARELGSRGARARVLDAGDLGRRFVRAARVGEVEALARQVLGERALLLDRVELLAGRERLSRLIISLLEAFAAARRAVAAACRVNPRALAGFDPRLAALLDGGFTARMGESEGARSLAALAARRAAREGVGLEELQGPQRSKRVTLARGAFVLEALACRFSPPEVASFLGARSPSAVARLASRARRRLSARADAPAPVE